AVLPGNHQHQAGFRTVVALERSRRTVRHNPLVDLVHGRVVGDGPVGIPRAHGDDVGGPVLLGVGRAAGEEAELEVDDAAEEMPRASLYCSSPWLPRRWLLPLLW